MKIFYIREKLWSVGCSFQVKDEADRVCYQVEGSVFKWWKTFTITDRQGHNLAQLKQKWSWLPSFTLTFADGRQLVIKEKFSWLRSVYKIEGADLVVKGNIWDMDFSLYQADQLVAEIEQKWFKLTSTYQVTVYDETYSDEVVAMTMAIDYVKERRASLSR